MESNGYYSLLKRNPSVRSIWLAQVVSEFGDWFNLVALLSLIAQFSGQAQNLGLLLIIQLVPFVLLSPIAGYVADRFDRRKVMIVADILRAIIVIGFLFVQKGQHLWLLYVLAACQFVLASFFEPARSAFFSSVATGHDLVLANALSAATFSVLMTVGTALGGAFISLVPIRYAFVVDASTFVMSALILSRMTSPLVHSSTHDHAMPSGLDAKPTDSSVRVLLQLFREHPGLVWIGLIKTGFAITGGVVWLLSGMYGQKLFPIGKNGALSLGILYGAMGLGAVCGSIWLKNHLLKRKGYASLVLILYCVRIAIFLAMGIFSSLIAVALACFLHMFTVAILWVLSTTLIQEHTPNHVQGRIFSLDNSMHTLSFCLMIQLTAWCFDRGISASQISLATAILAILVAGLWWGTAYRFARKKK